MYFLSSKIDVIEDTVPYVQLTISKSQAPLFVCYLEALRSGKIQGFSVGDSERNIMFSHKKGINMVVQLADVSLSYILTDNQIDVMEACGVDGVLDSYAGVHADFEFEKCDICISICD